LQNSNYTYEFERARNRMEKILAATQKVKKPNEINKVDEKN
jgi:hypothetical protein